jgi:hypothetical protein
MALEGAHESLACLDCHTDLEFTGTESDCVNCHLDVHQGELGIECDRCHGTRSFIDVADQRRTHRLARFPLTGSHAGTDCEACHPPTNRGQLRWLGVPEDCWACHEQEYRTAADPDHVAGGFLEQCEFCHGTASWAGGVFNHDRQLAGLSTVCVDCHQAEFDATTDPDHDVVPIPLNCEACHGTRTWDGARFDHDQQWFPVFSGRHREEWDRCSECHPNNTNYTVYDCLGCHPHSDRGETDNKHDGVQDYLYDSLSCFDCHPQGRNDE